MNLKQIENNKKFNAFYSLLIETNKQFNLTAITDKEEVFVKHFYDSIIVENEFENNAEVIDVGTGAGFPSVPLAIARKDLQITAIDALNKRINFVNIVAKELNINNLKAYHARSEDYVKTNREQFDIATSRAVAELSSLLELLAPFVKLGGKVICYKGKACEEEIKTANKCACEMGLKLEKTFSYNLGREDLNRTLVVYKKICNTPQKYPRANNKPIKNPIK